ncbi:uncharacterized protein SCHCODRAFT_02498780, partial [Schizophyllum commune H4-8]|uniref:uncharacterized protein n=1 Tax=Schizophyllum commune (strain H4-8 / FGSC 9210) TaxID=578458 RepID=UPI00215FE3D4
FIRERVETGPRRLPTDLNKLNNLFCQLTGEDVATLTELVKKAEVQGGRYPPAISADCITLAEWEARK